MLKFSLKKKKALAVTTSPPSVFEQKTARAVTSEIQKSTVLAFSRGGGVQETDVVRREAATPTILCRNRLAKRHRSTGAPRFLQKRTKRDPSPAPRLTEGALPEPILSRNSALARVRRDNAEDTYKAELELLVPWKPESYEEVPIEDFGMAMLLGMGYDPKEEHIEPLSLTRRAYVRAGLGADAAFDKAHADDAAASAAVEATDD
ncbi:MAG: uncharacterized protein KVP18_003872 [Porospora cf. gigantea A]|uniref:uncharacterized protein n=1 Tax=Porospora cf. gigantea A TaxID=2853593 RepID=UPI00355A1C10|nr:MAG: hypothetical protein KVP18_003872 [Porospora cf. gigantea A]